MEIIGNSPREIETVVNTNDLSVVLRDSSPDITAEITSDIEGVYFSLFGGDITEIEVVVPISDVAVHIERDGTMEINGTFDGGMEVLVCLDAMFGHTHDGRYYTKDESDDLIGGSEQRSMEYSDRSFAQAQEAQEMLRQSMLTYFSESINPVTVQTMSLLAGAVELQYRYVNSKTTPSVTVDGIYWNNTAKSLLVPANGIIQHMTIGITSITSARSASDYRYWDMQPFDSGALADGTKKYWLYAQVRRTGNTSSSDKDGYRLSETAIAFEDDVNYPAYYNLLVGLLSSETNANRSWVTMYGFTEILPGRITTDLIVSPSGKTYINLSAGEGEGEIGGKIKFIGSNGTVQNLDSTVDGLQAQIDGQIIAWFQEHDPTLANYPANEWTTDALKDQHLNDTFTNTDTGGCWRFTKVAGTYSWTVISDTATQQALIAAGHAQDTADGKKRVFTATPTTPYDVGDLWPGLSAGDLKVCTTARATGAYVGGDWVLATKYTDDTTANAAATAASNAQTSANTANSLLSDISSDSKLTPVEKQSVKLEWDVIVAEKSKIDGQADYYGVSKTAYGTAYSTLSSYISPLLSDLGATSNITGTTFRSNFAAYYAARQNLLDDIAEAAKDLGDLANANAIAAALVGNPNLILNGYRMYSSSENVGGVIQTTTMQLTAGKTYTFSVKGSKASAGATSRIYIDRIISGTRWAKDLELPVAGIQYINSTTFVCPETGEYGIGYWFQSSSLCEVEWVMLQEGNVYIDQNTVFKQTAEESIANLENLLEDSVSKTTIALGPTSVAMNIPLESGETYTFSIGSSTSATINSYSVRLRDDITSSYIGIATFNVGNTKQSFTFRTPNTGTYSLRVFTGIYGSTFGTVTYNNIMLQYGPFSTPWRRAISETAAGIAAGLEAKAKTDGFTTIEGGLITSNVIKLGNENGQERAGISGLELSEGTPVPFAWANGTLAEAIAGTAGVIIWRNGKAQFGRFRVGVDGSISIVDPTTGEAIIEFTAENVFSLAEIAASNIDVTKTPSPLPSASSMETGQTIWESTSGSDGSYVVTNAGTQVTILATIALAINNSSGSDPNEVSGISVDFDLLGGESTIYLGTCNLWQQGPGGDYKELVINETATIGPGTYSLKATVNFYKQGSMVISYSISDTSMRFVFNGSLKRNIFGKDGTQLSYDGYNFFRQAVNENHKLDVDLKTEGRFDVPGLLAAGKIDEDAYIENKVGAYRVTTATRTSTGVYVCTHNAPTYNIVPIVTVFNATAGYQAQVSAVSSSGDKTFTVKTTNAGGGAVNTDFFFTIFGNNQ